MEHRTRTRQRDAPLDALAARGLALLAAVRLVADEVDDADSLALLVGQSQPIDELVDLAPDLLCEFASRDEDESASAVELAAVPALEDALDERDGVGEGLARASPGACEDVPG